MLSCLVPLRAVAAPASDQPGSDSGPPRVLTPDNSSTFASLSRFTELLDALQKYYIQPSRIRPGPNTTVALRAFVRSVDPEADLLSPEEVASTNAAAGADVGIDCAIGDDYPVIIAPRDDSPAQEAGLLAGEQLMAVDGKSMLHARRVEVQQLLRGPANSPVTLRVLDPTTRATRDVRLQRAARKTPAGVVLKFLSGRIAYCRVPEFTHAAVEALHTAMARAKEERAPGVILDLRDNAGGKFEAAQVAASMFLPAGAPIVALDYADPSQRTSFVSDQGEKFTAPLVLLVNGGTAAEAEMVAAALQDHKRAQLIGSKTFGRGLLTTSVTLSDGCVLSVPTAYYRRPSNQIMHGIGVTPDIVVAVPRDTERLLAHIGFATFNWKNDKNAVLKTDLPLAKALAALAR
ncbi:MAG TPA: S41 family peptidase [Verrucomicrobiae bacterium]|nr:S41 family peptidase [Verrucomicrobiae bacterium]